MTLLPQNYIPRIKRLEQKENQTKYRNMTRKTPSHVRIDIVTVFDGSFENEALENEDRRTKHPNLETTVG